MADYSYPQQTVNATNPSVGTNTQTAPSSSTEIGIIDGSGNLQGVSATNPVPVTVSGSPPLPTGAATSSNQTTEITALQAIQANQTNGTQVVGLPSGASTSALQTTGNSSLSTIATNTTGVATAANQSTGNTSLATIATNTPTVGQKTMSGSSPVVIASDQSTLPVSIASAIPTKAPVNSNGSFSQASISSVATVSAPANAVGFLLEADSANTDNMRWCDSNSTASATNGMKLEPGRDTGYFPMDHAISICPASGTQSYTIQWVLSS